MNADAGLRMSVVNAAAELRVARAEFQNHSWDQIAVFLNNRGMATLDFPKALEIHGQIGWLDLRAETNRQRDLRLLAKSLIQAAGPIWLDAIPYGLSRVQNSVNDDVWQVFQSAGLVQDPPSVEAIDWWDTLACFARAEMDSQLLARGRQAELLSLEYETLRLASLGIKQKPRMVSLEDNTLGYDILSYELTPSGARETLIEVKSTTRKHPSFYLSRNEWNRALKSKDIYRFHIWLMPGQTLHEVRAEKVEAHIPIDRGSGIWQELFVEKID